MSSLKDRLNAQRSAIAANKASFIRTYKFMVGKTYFRLLPGIDDVDDFARDVGVHYIKDATGKIVAVVGDSEICFNRPDPIREAITQVILNCNERGDEHSAKLAKGWLARRSNVANLEIVGGVDTENKGKSVLYEFSDNQWDSILSIIQTMIEADDTWTMKDGIILVCDREGTGVQDTKYHFSVFPKQTPVSQATLDARTDLKAYVEGKFGSSVNKALTVLSAMLGRDVSQTAVGKALAGFDPTAIEHKPEADAESDPLGDLMDGDDLPDELKGTTPSETIIDAEVEELVADKPAPTPPAAQDNDLEAMMAELDAL